MTTAAILLAAGGGTRFEGETHKLLAPLRGRPVVCWALEAAIGAGLDQTFVVTGAVDLGAWLPEGVTAIANPRWAEGQATSLQLGLQHAGRCGHDAVVVGLGDAPFVEAEAWRRVAADPHPIAVATYDGARRNPVKLAAAVWPLLPSTGDEGARNLMRLRPELVGEVACPGHPGDIDTVEDLQRWN